MDQLKSVAAKGKGIVGVLLPDETSSTRYVEFDQPYLTEALSDAGLPSSDIDIKNALGSDVIQEGQASAMITAGASVLILDATDSGDGASIEAEAKDHGVAVIELDATHLGAPRRGACRRAGTRWTSAHPKVRGGAPGSLVGMSSARGRVPDMGNRASRRSRSGRGRP